MINNVRHMGLLYDFLYDNGSWEDYQNTRKEPHMSYRHLVRTFTRRSLKLSLKETAMTEAILLERPPVSHDSIINSQQQTDRIEQEQPALYKRVSRYNSKILDPISNDLYRRNREVKDQLFEDYRQMKIFDRLRIFEHLLYNEIIPPDLLKQMTSNFVDEHSYLTTNNHEMKTETEDFTLTDDQLKAFDEILEWFESDDPDTPMYKTLSGYAGTGKTTLLREVVGAIQNYSPFNKSKVAITATTNKAVKVLRQRIPDGRNFSTIHSLLNIKPKQVGTKEIFEQDDYSDSPPLSSFHLVIVDECSMISEKLLDIIYQENIGHTKILFCGDPAQLQPINEEVSRCFDFNASELVEVIRHGDTIANKAKLVRDSSKHVEKEELLDPPEIVSTEKREVWELFRGFRDNPDKARMLCWTNDQVDVWNRKLRLADWGQPTEHPFEPGDIVIANKPCLAGNDIIMRNSEEGIVQDVQEKKSNYLLSVKLYDGASCQVRVVKDEYKEQLKSNLAALRDARAWRDFWKLKKYYHDIKHCYAMTVHKSQGSTFGTIVMDWDNIHRNRDLQNRNQLIYVAMTRASEKVMII